MEKCLKVAELATLWGCSVPTTWNRIRKEGLQTIIKKDENGKDINYINISEEVINKYINNVVNNDNEVNNRGYYEELLTNNNNVNNIKTNDNGISASVLFDKLTTLNIEYNDRLERLNNELLTSQQKMLLLEDKAGREGMYLSEIKELEKENNKLKTNNKTLFIILITVITILITFFATYITIQNNISNKAELEVKQEAPQTVEIPVNKNHPKKK